MNDFTLKQSTMPLKSYESSTLIGFIYKNIDFFKLI